MEGVSLFEGLVLALVALGVIALIGILVRLGAIKRSLESGGAGRAAAAPEQQGEAPATMQVEEAEQREPQPEDVGVPPSEAPSSEEPPVETSVPSDAKVEPEEQPFQRDGRWWFRRGDELLFYDERSGQWEPAAEAPHTATEGETPARERATVTEEQPTVEAGAVTQEQPAVEAPPSFWRCPTCGAVNGSTATTCRMCFAPRP